MDEQLVEVLDISFITTTPGLTLHHTIRTHEGDALVEDGTELMRIQFGPREVISGNEKRKLPGKRVVIQGSHVVEMTSTVRLEPKVRPSAAALVNREKAALEALKQLHGVAGVPSSKFFTSIP